MTSRHASDRGKLCCNVDGFSVCNALKILDGMPEGKRPLGRTRHR
jgi:hypothetical protein